MKIRALATAALVAAAVVLPVSPAQAGPGPKPTPVPTCHLSGWYDPNVFCRTSGKPAHVTFGERRCAVLSLKDPLVYKTNWRCVQFAPLLVRGLG
jgi:hypothetical protein